MFTAINKLRLLREINHHRRNAFQPSANQAERWISLRGRKSRRARLYAWLYFASSPMLLFFLHFPNDFLFLSCSVHVFISFFFSLTFEFFSGLASLGVTIDAPLLHFSTKIIHIDKGTTIRILKGLENFPAPDYLRPSHRLFISQLATAKQNNCSNCYNKTLTPPPPQALKKF